MGLKILFISHKFYPDVGGIEVNSEILAAYFKKFGADVRLLTWSTDTTAKNFNFEVIRNPSVFELFKQFKWADVVYENNISLKLSWPQLFFRKPHVIAIRTWIRRMDGKKALPDYIKMYWLDKASQVISVSKRIAEVTYPKSEIIGNPYREELFKSYKPISERPKDFVFMGRLVSDKGADMAIGLIESLNKLKNLDKLHRLTLIGDGADRASLEQRVNQANLGNQIHFTGILRGKELVDMLNEHKYILIPSRWEEPFGNVALEGMACGCLPIVSNGGGLPDAAGKGGIVFERNSEESLFSETKKILNNASYENRIRSYFDAHLSQHLPEVVAASYFRIIKKSLEIRD